MIAHTSPFVPVAPTAAGIAASPTPDVRRAIATEPDPRSRQHPAITVWSIPLTGLRCGRPGGIECLVTRAEAERASRFRRPEDRRRFLACRRVLRSLLEDLTGIPSHLLPIETAPGGKPILRDHEDVHFNLSHTRDLAVIALTTGPEVGVDVESLDTTFPVMATAREFFQPHEVETLANLELRERAHLFFRLWCAREAALKAIGSGFAEYAPEQIDVDLEAAVVRLRPAGAPIRELHLREAGIGPHHVGMVAHNGAADTAVDHCEWIE